MTISDLTDNVSQRRPNAAVDRRAAAQQSAAGREMGDQVTKAAAGDHGAAVRAERQRAEDARGQNDAMRVLSYLLAGVIFYGGLGWLVDRWLHTSFLLPIGVVLGAGLGVFTVIRRFGARALEDVETPAQSTPAQSTQSESQKERR